jgi:hypothetical protein
MVLVPEVVACDGGFVTLVDMILPGRGLLGNRSHAWLDTVASFGLEYERALGPAGHLKDEAGWLGVNWLRGLRSTQEAVVRPSYRCAMTCVWGVSTVRESRSLKGMHVNAWSKRLRG